MKSVARCLTAVSLFLFLPFVGCGDADHGADAESHAPGSDPGAGLHSSAQNGLATLTERREARVFCVYFAGSGATSRGGTSEVLIRVEPNTTGVPAVGVIEEFIEGTGNQWQAAAWMAAFNASTAAQVSLADYEFQVRSTGHIDGPSAGMLTTATMLALLTGAELRTDSTMTGTINPDGTAGPVGGIPLKIEGAKERGLTRFGYPLGCRNTLNERSGATEDIHVVGRKLGMEVKEIRDLADAYEFMTGQRLPEFAEASETEMELPEVLRSQIKAKLLGWKAEFDASIPVLLNQVSRLPDDFAATINGALNEISSMRQTAEQFERNGMAAAALGFWSEAAVLAEITKNQLVFMENFIQADFDSILAQIETMRAVEGKVEALKMELAVKSQRSTVGGQVNVVMGYHYAVMAKAFADQGRNSYAQGLPYVEMIRDGRLNDLEDSLAVVGDYLAQPLIHYAAAEALLKIARQQMDISGDEGGQPAATPERIGVLARGYSSAAGASLEYFDSLITSQLETDGVTAAQAKVQMGEWEFTYPLIRSAAAQAQWVQGESPEFALLRLGAGAQAYLGAGGLVNKYYAIGMNRNADGTKTLSNRRALTYLLDQARKRARQAAGRCKDRLGFIPSAAMTTYENAIAYRERSDEDKLIALEEFWASTFWSDLAVMLARE